MQQPKIDESINKKLMDISNEIMALQSNEANINHPLYHEFSKICDNIINLIQKSVQANKSYIFQVNYNFKLIEELNKSVNEIRAHYNEDKKKLTESLGAAYLQTEQMAKELTANTESLNKLSQEKIDQLLAENQELKNVAKENIKESQLKSEFLNVLSHELRTPLNAIIGYSQIIKNGIYGPVNESIDNDIDSINKNGKHLLKMINQFLDYAKFSSNKAKVTKVNVELEFMLESVIRQTNSLIEEKPINFHVIIDEDIKNVVFDKDRVFQALFSIVDNAIKHTEKGDITLRATLTLKDSTNYLQLTVEDTGSGIEKDELKNIFDPFHQVHHTINKAKGTGLGLAITKKIIELHDGRIEIESIVNEGTKVHIFLPQF